MKRLKGVLHENITKQKCIDYTDWSQMVNFSLPVQKYRKSYMYCTTSSIGVDVGGGMR